MYFTVNGQICPPSQVLYMPRDEQMFPMDYWEKCNSVTCYRGERIGIAHLLVNGTVATAIASLTGPVTIQTVDEISGTTNLVGWTVTRCEGTEAYYDGNDVYYCQLRDRRWIANQVKVSDSFTLFEDSHDFAVTSSMTWQAVLEALWGLMPANAVGTSATCPTLATTPSSYAENIDLDGVPLWDAICQVCNACGHVAVYNPLTDAYSFQTHLATQSGLAALLSANSTKLIWNSNAPIVSSGNNPETVKITFKPRLQTLITHSQYGKPYVVSTATGMSGSVSGSVYAIQDTSLTMTNGSNLLNTTQLNNRATELTRYIKAKADAVNRRASFAYSALIGFVPGSEVSSVSWSHHPRKGVHTHLEYFEEFELFLPKPSSRNYAVVEVVSVTSYTPDGNGLYDGEVQRYRPSTNTWETLYTCKVKDLNG
jgi:hypothetical protein